MRHRLSRFHFNAPTRKLLVSHLAFAGWLGAGCSETEVIRLPGDVPSRVTISAEEAGSHCPTGGQRVATGLDEDLDGLLDTGEVSTVSYVCNGAAGSDGASGSNGAQGSDGTPGSNGAPGADGVSGSEGLTARVDVQPEAAGGHCATGGNAISSGLDLDRDGELDASEITQVQYVCDGATGDDGKNTLISMSIEPAGSTCPAGGQIVSSGSDDDGDGILSAGEVESTVVVCNGADATPVLIRQDVESMGANCTWGGSAVHSGLDSDRSGALENGEIDATSYICNGADGLNTIFRLEPLSAGSPDCAAGGTLLETGLDANRDGQLGSSEVLATRAVCHGIASRVLVSDEPAGPECAQGGKKIETGLDANGSGSLDAGEVNATEYVCNGLNSLVSVSAELPGDNCSLGGQKLEVGLDLDADQVLDPNEIQQTSYVCDGAGFLLRANNEEPGATCQLGGIKLDTGTDSNDDGDLDDDEVLHTDYVCNQDRSGVVIGLEADALTAGGHHNCATLDGEVWCWGYNGNGELADATGYWGTAGKTSIDDIDGLVSRVHHNCGLRDGAVYCWGANWNGQLGNNQTVNSAVPVQAGSFTAATAVATSNNHSCAVEDGEVWCWGYNGEGQLGDGTTTNSLIPVQVPGLTGVTGIAAGAYHTCVISNGAVSCWGYNYYGQLGDGTALYTYPYHQFTPVSVIGLSDVSAISLAEHSSCAIAGPDDEVHCWGHNGSGQLGDGTTTASSVPVLVSGLSGVTRIAMGGASHACAIASDQAYCWGNNGSGQLGDGTSTQRSAPVAVAGLSNATEIAAGYEHSCAIDDGEVKCWGHNGNGQLGIGSTSGSYSLPVLVRRGMIIAP